MTEQIKFFDKNSVLVAVINNCIIEIDDSIKIMIPYGVDENYGYFSLSRFTLLPEMCRIFDMLERETGQRIFIEYIPSTIKSTGQARWSALFSFRFNAIVLFEE